MAVLKHGHTFLGGRLFAMGLAPAPVISHVMKNTPGDHSLSNSHVMKNTPGDHSPESLVSPAEASNIAE